MLAQIGVAGGGGTGGGDDGDGGGDGEADGGGDGEADGGGVKGGSFDTAVAHAAELSTCTSRGNPATVAKIGVPSMQVSAATPIIVVSTNELSLPMGIELRVTVAAVIILCESQCIPYCEGYPITPHPRPDSSHCHSSIAFHHHR